jgi:hypothetical protein
MEEANYACVLPANYLHMLNCTVHFSMKCDIPTQISKCKTVDDDGLNGTFSLCRRLTANQIPALYKNAYLKPTYKRPYYYINTSSVGGKISAELEAKNILDPCGEEASDYFISTWQNDINKILNPCADDLNVDCKVGKIMEIRCGRNNGFYPDVAYVDYLKYPKIINLT